MSHWDMYWFTRLDNLQGLFLSIGIIALFSLLILAMAGDIKSKPYFKDHWIKATVIGLLFLSMGLLTPTQKEAAAIWLVPKMVNNEQLGGIAKDTLSILETQTKQYLNNLLAEEVVKE